MRTTKHKIDLTQLKPGNVLVAQEFWTSELFNRSVILILKHDEEGTAGLILNKSNTVYENLSAYSKSAQRGESFDVDNSGILCKLKEVSKYEKFSEAYDKDKLTQLRKLITSDKNGRINPKSFVVLTAWEPGQLEQQVIEKKWWVHDFNVQELYESGDTDLWTYKLIQSKNLYGLFSEMPDPILN